MTNQWPPADLLFAEPPRIMVEDHTVQAQLDQVVNTPVPGGG